MKKYHFITLSIFILIMVLPVVDLYALCINQSACCSANPPPPQFCNTCAPCPQIPLDGGLSVLLVAGLAYGSKKIFGKSKS